MKRAPRVQFIAITLLAVLAFSNPLGRCATSKYAIISQSGQGLSSVFEGLRPSLAQLDRLWQYHPASRGWKGIISHRLPGLTPVSIIGGGSCPGTSVCSGNFTVIVPSGGCTDCAVHNFTIDPNGDCFAGEQDTYCGENCCVDAQDCFNRYGCAR